MLTTAEAAALLTERGVRAKDGGPVRPATVVQWINRGKFPGATKEGSIYRGQWRIPRAELDGFTQSKPGRRPRAAHDASTPPAQGRQEEEEG